MGHDDPFGSAESVGSRADLIRHVMSLRADLLANSEEWENISLERFLEALAAWVRDMDGYFINRGESPPDQPSWALFAQMLCAAAVYE